MPIADYSEPGAKLGVLDSFILLSSSVPDTMSDTPVTFRRKGARPAQRARAVESDATVNSEPGSEAAAGSGDEPPSALAAKLKNKHKSRLKPKTRLSFGVEEVRGRMSISDRMLISRAPRRAKARSSSSRSPTSVRS